jgi:polar amino acid transport system substrate-binding protein
MSENDKTGLYFKLIEEMNNYYDDGTIIIRGIYPFKRSLHNLLNGKADAHLPILRSDNVDIESLEYNYSTAKLYQGIFVLYTNKNKERLDINKLENYILETDLAHIDLFGFPIQGSTSIENSLRVLNAGRIDGIIYAQFIVDHLVSKHNYTNIRKQLYKAIDIVFALPKTKEGAETNKILTKIINEMHADGSIERIFGEYSKRKFSTEIIY